MTAQQMVAFDKFADTQQKRELKTIHPSLIKLENTFPDYIGRQK